MSGARTICARCGADCDATVARRCDCDPCSELGAVVLAAVRLAGPDATPRDIGRELRRVARDRDEQRRRAS